MRRGASDCGTENGVLAAIQCEFRGTTDALVFGSSPSNQRIEEWWSFYRRNRSTWWINYFKDLIEKDEFHPGNQLEEEALWYCFSRILQEDLDLVREHSNTHRSRDSKHNTVPGRPDEVFFLPECNGGIDGYFFQFLLRNYVLCQTTCYSMKMKLTNFRITLTTLRLTATFIYQATGERQNGCICNLLVLLPSR